MKFSENWLRELVDIPLDRVTLLDRLTMAGLEVEGVEPLGAALEGVVVAEIIDCEPHPNADKLRVCQVAFGKSATVTIVCGAPNARAGLKAPLATVGTTMPSGAVIKRAMLRGIESNGMLCSAKELGIDADASGLMELSTDARVGTSLATYLGLPDASIEVKLTPNRPDCLSLLGLARDAAALCGSVLHAPVTQPVAVTSTAARGVRVEYGADCPRYLGRVIEGVDASARSPLWLAERLRRSGVRPVSAIVDVTNMVMLELGQPLHAFDNDTLEGVVAVRRGRAGETVQLLDGSNAKVDSQFLVIADQARPLALAGIMGGQSSRVTDATRNIFLESAHFSPSAIIGRSRRLGLHTDASHRFERGVDPELPRAALERASSLLIGIAGGKAGPITEAVDTAALPRRAAIPLRRERLARLLDITIDDAQVERILAALGLVLERSAEGWRATPPSWRFDLAIEEDLIEEVVRVFGYDRVPTVAPRGPLPRPVLPEAQVGMGALRAQLVARDYVEAICYAFVAAETLSRWQLDVGTLELANPLSADFGVMRPSLLPGLITVLAANQRRQHERVRLFEVGNVFRIDANETLRVAGVACGRAFAEQWAEPHRAVDFFDIKGDVDSVFALTNAPMEFGCLPATVPWLHPGQSAQCQRSGKPIGYVGALHPDLLNTLGIDSDVFAFELDVTAITPSNDGARNGGAVASASTHGPQLSANIRQ